MNLTKQGVIKSHLGTGVHEPNPMPPLGLPLNIDVNLIDGADWPLYNFHNLPNRVMILAIMVPIPLKWDTCKKK